MDRVKLLVPALLLLLAILPANAQEKGGRFFVSPLFEAIGYSQRGLAYGGGAAIGTGSGGALGLRFLIAKDSEDFVSTEMLVFARLYFLGRSASAGPFIQLNGGFVLYGDNKVESAGSGSVSAGLAAGWRFPLGRLFFIEPVARGGYPYFYGGGISAGLRF